MQRPARDRVISWVLGVVCAAYVAGVVVLALPDREDPGAAPASDVVVAPDVLDAQGQVWLDEDGEVDGWSTSPVFFVAPGDTDAAVDAVVAAAVRFLAINEHGREIADWEQSAGFYTPGYVDVLRSDGGVALVTDTDGDLSREQGDAMVEVLVEELRARGVAAWISAPPDGWEDGASVPTPFPEEPQPPKGMDRRWYVLRNVHVVAATGVPYQEPEWRRADGTWTRDRTTAEVFAAPPLELLEALRAEPRRDDVGEPTALRMPVDPAYVPWPLPPDDLRAPD